MNPYLELLNERFAGNVSTGAGAADHAFLRGHGFRLD